MRGGNSNLTIKKVCSNFLVETVLANKKTPIGVFLFWNVLMVLFEFILPSIVGLKGGSRVLIGLGTTYFLLAGRSRSGRNIIALYLWVKQERLPGFCQFF